MMQKQREKRVPYAADDRLDEPPGLSLGMVALSLPAADQAPHRLPLLFFAEHPLDIVQTLANCRSSLLNGRGWHLPGICA